MIDRSLATDERVSLITDVLSDHDETEAVQNLRGSDAQSFVDVVDEVIPHFSSSGDRSAYSNSTPSHHHHHHYVE